jgi:hypothetical protein
MTSGSQSVEALLWQQEGTRLEDYNNVITEEFQLYKSRSVADLGFWRGGCGLDETPSPPLPSPHLLKRGSGGITPGNFLQLCFAVGAF